MSTVYARPNELHRVSRRIYDVPVMAALPSSLGAGSWRMPRPPAKRAMKGARLTKPHQPRPLCHCRARRGEITNGQLAVRLIEEGLEGRSLSGQATLQVTGAHRRP